MKNWKDYVGYQKIKDDPNGTQVSIFFMYSRTAKEPETLGFVVERVKCDLDMTESEVVDWIVKSLATFPVVECRNDVDLYRAKIKVADETKRGTANTNYENIWFYKGSNPYDGPLYVTEWQGRFAVFKHPNFEKYGFVVK